MLKRLTLAVITLVLVAVSVSAASAEDTDRVVVRIDGLSCPFCVYGLEKKLTKIEGVASFDVNMKSGEAILGLDHENNANEESIKKAVKDAGFTTSRITFYNGENLVKEIQ